MRLLMLCCDGLGVDWFERCFVDALPGAQWGELHSPQPSTGPGWTSVLTGLPVAEHGVTSLTGTAHSGSKTFADLPGRYLWDVLPGTCGMLAVPTTYPPRGRPGDWMVSGFPFRPACYPHGLLDGIDYVGDYAKIAVTLVKRRDGDTYWPRYTDWYRSLAILQMIVELRLDALERLPAVDNLFVGIVYFDRIGHLLQGSASAPHDRLEALDEAACYVLDLCKRLMDKHPAALTVLASDHGIDDGGGHDKHGAWAMWGSSETGRRDLQTHELRAVIEGRLSGDDPEVIARMRALGYMEDA